MTGPPTVLGGDLNSGPLRLEADVLLAELRMPDIAIYNVWPPGASPPPHWLGDERAQCLIQYCVIIILNMVAQFIVLLTHLFFQPFNSDHKPQNCSLPQDTTPPPPHWDFPQMIQPMFYSIMCVHALNISI